MATFTRTFQIFLPLRCNRMASVGWSWVFGFPRLLGPNENPSRLGSGKIVSLEGVLVRRAECSRVLQNCCFPPLPAGCVMQFLHVLHCDMMHVVGLLEVRLTKVYPFPPASPL